MTDAKTIVSVQEVHNFLEHEHIFFQKIEPISGGEISQAFCISTGHEEIILRVNNKRRGFDKDYFAKNHFSSRMVPIPKVFFIKQWRNQFYCLTEKASGDMVFEEYMLSNPGLLESVFNVLTAISITDISNSHGFGTWDVKGNGTYTSWHQYLISMRDHELWQRLAADGVLDVNHLVMLYEMFEAHISFLPEERKLVHGDMGNDNMFALGSNITAITDWDQSMYGDPLFDVAWLEFWAEKIDYLSEYKRYCSIKNHNHSNIDERIKAYLLYLSITTLVWYMEVNHPDGYHWLRNRLVQKYHW